jgi:hypothetical protein
MQWEDERYVRLYTRDTLTWTRLGWQGQAVLSLLMRKVDRAGVIEIEDEEPAVALSGITGVPIEICDVAWLRLSAGKRPTVTIRDEPSRALVMPNFLDAQEARQSDKARARKSRELRRVVTKRDEPSHGVTQNHDRSHGVTPSCAVPSRTDQDQKASSAPAPTAGPSPIQTPADSKASQASSEALSVFGEWCRVMGKNSNALFTPERRKKVEARLREGYTVERLFKAIRGCKASPHHQGQNEHGTVYDDLELVCRDGKHVETFEAFADRPPTAPNGARKGYVPLTGTADRFKDLQDDSEALGLKLEPKPKESPGG